MNMEKKFREALLKVLADKTFKNESALCAAAGVNQGGVNKFIRTAKFRAGECEQPAHIKDNLNLDIVSKLVDIMGGSLVFPWDSPEAGCSHELENLKKELAEKTTEIKKLETENNLLKQLIRDIAGKNIRPEDARQNKNCA